jgi:hypothetical protein
LQLFDDGNQMRQSLPFPEDHFRKPLTQRPMVVHLSKAKVCKWQIVKLRFGRLKRNGPRLNLLKKRS